jgi:hypothetical protein
MRPAANKLSSTGLDPIAIRQIGSARLRLVAMALRGILPFASGQISEQVRQSDRKLAKPGILLRERQDIRSTLAWRFLVPGGRGLFKQRRQNIEKLVIRRPWRRDVAASGAAAFPVARRMSDAHGRSLDLGRTLIPSCLDNLD